MGHQLCARHCAMLCWGVHKDVLDSSKVEPHDRELGMSSSHRGLTGSKYCTVKVELEQDRKSQHMHSLRAQHQDLCGKILVVKNEYCPKSDLEALPWQGMSWMGGPGCWSPSTLGWNPGPAINRLCVLEQVVCL